AQVVLSPPPWQTFLIRSGRTTAVAMQLVLTRWAEFSVASSSAHAIGRKPLAYASRSRPSHQARRRVESPVPRSQPPDRSPRGKARHGTRRDAWRIQSRSFLVARCPAERFQG